jgi:phenylacetate-CoA ligase
VKEFQIHQLSVNRLLVLIVLHDQRSFTSAQRIERITREYMGQDMRIDFEVRESIPLTPSGKRRITVSHLSSSTREDAIPDSARCGR